MLAATIQGSSRLQRQSDPQAHSTTEHRRQRAANPSFIRHGRPRKGPYASDPATWLRTPRPRRWLSITEAPIDLRWQALRLARHAAGDRDTAAAEGLVAAASARVGLAAGAFHLAQAVLDAVTVPTNTSEMMQLAGFLALRRSVVAAADGQSADVDASVDYATDLAERTGESNAYGLGFGPIKVGLYRMTGTTGGRRQ